MSVEKPFELRALPTGQFVLSRGDQIDGLPRQFDSVQDALLYARTKERGQGARLEVYDEDGLRYLTIVI